MPPEGTTARWIVSPIKAGSILLAFGIIVFVLVRIGMMEADWNLCIRSPTGQYTPASFADQVWSGLLGALEIFTERRTFRGTALTYGIAFSPIFVIAVARARWIWIATLLLLVFPALLVMDGDGHHCDRKGCVACTAIGIWAAWIQFPIVVTTLCVIGFNRFIEVASPRRTRRLDG